MLDRQLQLRILETLAATYPEGSYNLLASFEEQGRGPADERSVLVNTQYLAEHGLLVSGYRRRGTLSDDSFISVAESVITASGLDFLAEDGGLGAILSVVTVRLDRESLQALIEACVEASDAPPEKKSAIKSALQSLSSGAWSELAKRLVGAAIDHGPQGIDMLQRLLAQL